MSYTISEAAQKTGLPPSTIRYYDKEGLLPNIKRKNGIRVFEDMDLRLMGLLTCLKNTGMPIKRIRDYVELTSKGDDTLQERYEIIKAQRQFVLDQIEQLQYYLEELDFKDWYYNKALAAGSVQYYLEELDFKDWYYNKALAAGSESAINLDDYEKETGKKAPDDPNRQD